MALSLGGRAELTAGARADQVPTQAALAPARPGRLRHSRLCSRLAVRYRPVSGLQRARVMLVSTTNDIPGRTIVRHIGLVRGITVRSRSALGNFAGGIQSLFGGKLTVFVSLAETARQEAFDHLCEHATEAGANAIIGMRYDANEIMEGITEVLAYGTAVVVSE
jgi:uncharacterized protein YbjQ (UPF0145 family)